jgi:hypothetical protein
VINVGDTVKVKLREPVGNATTETANKYLRQFNGLGRVLDKTRYTIRVTFNDGPMHIGRFFDDELEKV